MLLGVSQSFACLGHLHGNGILHFVLLTCRRFILKESRAFSSDAEDRVSLSLCLQISGGGSQEQRLPSGEILAETLQALGNYFFSHMRNGQFLGNLVIALRAEGTARVKCMRWEYTCCIRVAERRLGRLWGAVRAGRGSPQPERGAEQIV